MVSMVIISLADRAAFNLSPGTGVLLQVDPVMTFSSPTVSIETLGSSPVDAVVLALVGVRGISRVIVSQCVVSLSFEYSGSVAGVSGACFV